VTSYEPPRYVALLNHGMGITAEQQVTFATSLRGDTRVRMIVDFVGKSPGVPEEAVQEAITFYTHDALDTMAALCKKWKAAFLDGLNSSGFSDTNLRDDSGAGDRRSLSATAVC